MRDWLVFFHILGAAGWIGGGLHGWFSTTQIARASGPGGQALVTLTKVADRYFGPVAILTLLTGIGLVWSQDAWTWDDTFVLVGIGVFVFSAVWQPMVAAKTEKRLVAAVTSGDDASAEIRASHRVASVDVAVLLVALWSMVVKLGA